MRYEGECHISEVTAPAAADGHRASFPAQHLSSDFFFLSQSSSAKSSQGGDVPNIALSLIIMSLQKCNPENSVPLSLNLIRGGSIHSPHCPMSSSCNTRGCCLPNNCLLPMGLVQLTAINTLRKSQVWFVYCCVGVDGPLSGKSHGRG